MRVCQCILGSNPENCKHCNNNSNREHKTYTYTCTTRLPKTKNTWDDFDYLEFLGKIKLLEMELEKAKKEGYNTSKLFSDLYGETE